MKKINNILLGSVVLFAAACNNGTGSDKDSVQKADSVNSSRDTTGNMSQEKKDTMAMPINDDAANFAVKAANGGMAEVALGKLAEEKATKKDIKDFGSMMVKDHSKANDELKTIAADKRITLPATMGDDMQKNIDDLSKKSGDDFDKSYVKMMVSDHKDDISDFEKEIKDAKDSTMKNFAIKTLPVLSKHLGAIMAIEKANHY